MVRKFSGMLAILIVCMLALTGIAAAVPVDIDKVKINGDEVDPEGATIRDIERGDSLEIRVEITATGDANDVEVTAFISGYDHDDRIIDTTDVFDMDEGVTYVKKLNVVLPDRMDKDEYKLRIIVTDRAGDLTQSNYDLIVSSPRHALDIRDVVFSPDNTVIAGRALLAIVRLKNVGDKLEESIKVKVSIPELGVSDTDYIDELDEGDSISSEELYLRIPQCAPTGKYIVNVEVTYDDGDEVISEDYLLNVLESDTCEAASTSGQAQEDKTILTVPGVQKLKIGGAVVSYPVMITNAAGSDKTYTISVSGMGQWGTYAVDPSTVVLVRSGQSETANVMVKASDDASPGEKVFLLTIKSGDDQKQIPLTASLEAGAEPADASSWTRVKKGLEIGLVILVVLLVILGLIIGFNKLKGDSEPDDEAGQTYY